MTHEPDFITLEATLHPERFLVVIRTWRQDQDEFIIRRVSGPHKLTPAKSLGRAWAAATGLEFRYVSHTDEEEVSDAPMAPAVEGRAAAVSGVQGYREESLHGQGASEALHAGEGHSVWVTCPRCGHGFGV